MKDLLKKMQIMEQEMDRLQERADYWMQEEYYNEEKSEEYERQSDRLYEKLFALNEKAVDHIVSITSGSVDRKMARAMLQIKRAELERIFA